MPERNEIRRGKEIGYTAKNTRFIWHACEGCGKERWVLIIKEKPNRAICASCKNIGSNNALWKGGHTTDNQGYVYTYVYLDDFFASMRSKRRCYVAEHRLVMAQHLCRCLLPWEVVHHKNGVKNDNRLENLTLLSSRSLHMGDILLRRENKKLRRQVAELEIKIKLLAGKFT